MSKLRSFRFYVCWLALGEKKGDSVEDDEDK
jgi:hypothetical protein